MIRKPRWLRALLALDQLANVVFLGGDEDETISSHAGKQARGGARWACILCRFLDLFQEDHCHLSEELDEGKPVLRGDPT